MQLYYSLLGSPDGAVRPSTVVELAKEQGVKLPTYDVNEFAEMLSVRNKDTASLEEYLEAFQYTLAVMQKPEAITRVMYEVCCDAVADGVRYLEVRFSPILHIQHEMALSQVMEAICEGVALAGY